MTHLMLRNEAGIFFWDGEDDHALLLAILAEYRVSYEIVAARLGCTPRAVEERIKRIKRIKKMIQGASNVGSATAPAANTTPKKRKAAAVPIATEGKKVKVEPGAQNRDKASKEQAVRAGKKFARGEEMGKLACEEDNYSGSELRGEFSRAEVVAADVGDEDDAEKDYP